MEKFNIEEEVTICPACGHSRYWIKYYCNQMIRYCSDCGYFEILEENE